MHSTVLKGNKNESGGLINGCILWSSYTNNVFICSFLEVYDFPEYYGFTKAEVADLLNMLLFKDANKNDILSYYNSY